jgi:hypothetical protein
MATAGLRAGWPRWKAGPQAKSLLRTEGLRYFRNAAPSIAKSMPSTHGGSVAKNALP